MSIEPGKTSRVEWWPLNSNGTFIGGLVDLTPYDTDMRLFDDPNTKVTLHGGPCDGIRLAVRESRLVDGAKITGQSTDCKAVYRWREGRFEYDPEETA